MYIKVILKSFYNFLVILSRTLLACFLQFNLFFRLPVGSLIFSNAVNITLARLETNIECFIYQYFIRTLLYGAFPLSSLNILNI